MTAIASLIMPYLARFWSYGALATLALLAWHFDARAVANADLVRAQAASFRSAAGSARQLALDALHHQETVYQTKAQETDIAYQSSLAEAWRAADVYIASHRVRAAPIAVGGGATIASAARVSSGIPAGVPGDAIMVSTDDVHRCTNAAGYALAAHNWAAAINP